MSQQGLNKRLFMAGTQCPLRLYNLLNRTVEASPPNEVQAAIFATSRELEALATRKFPNATQIPTTDIRTEEAAKLTKQAFDSGSTEVIEAAFFSPAGRTRIDIVRRDDNGKLHLIEIKASARLKPAHQRGMAWQTYMVESAGYKVASCQIWTVNRNYTLKDSGLNLNQFFTQHDITEGVSERIEKIAEQHQEALKVLPLTSPPSVAVGSHCNRPHPCEFKEVCMPAEEAPPDDDLLQIPECGLGTRERLLAQGVRKIDDIENLDEFDAHQRRAIIAIQNRGPRGSKELAQKLTELTYPIHHIDFECYALTIPRFTSMQPFESLPFQFSNHIEYADGHVEHRTFLYEGRDDPREEFTKALLHAVGKKGTLCIYSNYETVAINRLADVFPSIRKELQAIARRTFDLAHLIKHHFYHPEFNGSYSLKSVLPALVGDMGYDGLVIKDGRHAMESYMASIDQEDEAQRQRVFSALHEYCAVDSFALLRIRHELEDFASLGNR